MKVLRYSLLTMMLCFSIAIIFSCGSKHADDKSGKEYTSAYICPMHCEGSGSDEAGTCPVCKMDYVANADAIEETKKEEHNHDHDHHGHDHSHDGHNH